MDLHGAGVERGRENVQIAWMEGAASSMFLQRSV